MPAAQIYSVVNTIASNIGYTGSTVVDVTTFTAFAQAALTGVTESVYSTLYDLIGRTVIAIDEADEDERNIVVDAFEYGSILQKISFANQSAESSSEWDIANPESPFAELPKTGIVAEYFEQTIPTFSWKDVAYDDQLREAFRTPESLAGFTDGLFQRMRNAYQMSKNGLADNAVGAMIGYLVVNTADPNYTRRVRHLLTEFTGTYTQFAGLTADDAMITPEYLEYVRKQIIIDKKNLNKMTKLYNTGTVERRSTDADLNLDLSLALTTAYQKFWGDTYNDNYVMLPKHNEIVNWGIATSPQEVVVSIDAGQTTTTVTDILGLLYDRDGVVATMDKSRFVNFYDQWNARNVFKLTANRRYICDPSENAILYLND